MAIRRHGGLFWVGVFLLLTSAAHANLPDSFNGWQTTGFQPIPASRLSRFAGDDAPVLQEYGFASGQRREYARNNAKLTVTLWQMKDASGSFGLFTFYQQQAMSGAEGEDAVLASPGRWLARRGLYVVDVRGEGLERQETAMLLAEVPRLRPTGEFLPLLPDYLPEENLIARSTKFLMGPAAFARLETNVPPAWIGFDLGAEAVLAQYRSQGSRLRFLLVTYATPQLAAKQLRSFQELAAESKPPALGTVYLRRKGSVLGVVLDSPQQALAEKLLDGVRYESVVTWNERAPSPRDNIGNLMLAVFFLAGFMLLIALMGGIFFGGFRVLAKKFLPWAIFDRPEQMEIIRLHLYDK